MLLVAAVDARPLNVTISGNVRATPNCEFDVVDWDLGTIDSSVFSGVGTGSNWVPVDVVSRGCTSPTTTMDWVYTGTPDTSNPNAFKTVGTATGVAIEMKVDDANPILPAGTRLNWAKQGMGGVYKHYIRYVQTSSTITRGNAGTSALVSITYN